MKKLHKIALSLYCITLALICQAFLPISSVSAASAQNFKFQSYEADYYLSRTTSGVGQLRVREELTALFPAYDQNHGLTRIIPFTNQAGKNLTIPDLKHFEVQAWQNRQPIEPYSIEQADGYFEVKLGDPDTYVHGRQVYTLEYTFENVITNFDDYQELYWDTNGVDWPQAFDSLTVRIHLDDDLVDQYTQRAWCYVGSYGSKNQNCHISQDDGLIEITTGHLSSHENLTFDLEFKPQTFVIVETPTNYILLYTFILELLIGVALFIFAFYVYRATLEQRKYYKSLFVTPQYTPPAGLTVAEAAECSLQNLSTHTKVATLLELAVHGKIELIENQSENSKKPIWTIRIKDLQVSEEERIVLQILRGKSDPFTPGEEFMLNDHRSNTTLARLSTKYPKAIQRQVHQKGLLVSDLSASKPKYSRAEQLCNRLITLSAIWAFIGPVTILIVHTILPSYGEIFGKSGSGISPFGILMVVTAFISFLVPCWIGTNSLRYAARTEAGLRTARYLEGLKLYIKMAEQDRIIFLQSVPGADTSHQGIVKLYEKLLPYAVLFGLEKSWLSEMSRYYEYSDVAAPSWYFGYGTFSARSFNEALNSATSSVNSSFISASPSGSSSSSSGGSGGGFSGGGGGGGGGGGW